MYRNMDKTLNNNPKPLNSNPHMRVMICIYQSKLARKMALKNSKIKRSFSKMPFSKMPFYIMLPIGT